MTSLQSRPATDQRPKPRRPGRSLVPWLARLAAALFYRVERVGRLPRRGGPFVVVSNHPNALMDSVLVAAALERPASFLAKAPLFDVPVMGACLRFFGALAVYRRQDFDASDEAARQAGNATMFADVNRTLADGAGICLFPEGRSHDSDGRLLDLRTGTARMLLQGERSDVTVLPVALHYERKGRFRSRVQIVCGEEVVWDDLAAAEASDRKAVVDLTRRIHSGLAAVLDGHRPTFEQPEVSWFRWLAAVLVTPIAGLAGLILAPAFVATDLMAHRGDHDAVQLATDKGLAGMLCYGLWMLLLFVAALATWGSLGLLAAPALSVGVWWSLRWFDFWEDLTSGYVPGSRYGILGA